MLSQTVKKKVLYDQLVDRPLRKYIDQLVDDTGLRIEDIPVAMSDRLGWREHISSGSEISRSDDDIYEYTRWRPPL